MDKFIHIFMADEVISQLLLYRTLYTYSTTVRDHEFATLSRVIYISMLAYI